MTLFRKIGSEVKIWVLDFLCRLWPWKFVRRDEFNELVRDYQLMRADFWDFSLNQIDKLADNIEVQKRLQKLDLIEAQRAKRAQAKVR